MDLFCDNKAAIDISQNPLQHNQTKQVEFDWHFMKQNFEDKMIRFPLVKSEDQLVDTCRKAMSIKNFYNSPDKLGIYDNY